MTQAPDRLTVRETVEHANEIHDDYARQGLRLTLRQMYYRFVATGLSANSQAEYKLLGKRLTAARYAGAFPVDGLEDRGRTSDEGDFTADYTNLGIALRNAGRLLQAAPERHIGRAHWYGQPAHVSVWVEKEALSGVIGDAAARRGVSWMACKGYPSLGALDEWLTQLGRACQANAHAEAVILYFGDHDPDGFQIPRSALESLAKLQAVKYYGDLPPIRLERVALNMTQVEQFNPPPFPAKMSSSRYRGYVDEHDTQHAWELDALEPATLQALVSDRVAALFENGPNRANCDRVRAVQGQMREAMAQPGWAAQWLGGGQ